jgi:nitroreductase / dihydropteridine reductase
MSTPFIDSLHWRYATKQFDTTKKLTPEQVETITEAVRFAPSSYGLQPLKCIVVGNAEMKVKVQEAAYDQTQVSEASHVLVFCSLTDITAEYVDRYIAHSAQERQVAVESLQGYRNAMVKFIEGKTTEQKVEWMKKQVYLALGIAIAACALERIDACPMEGFNSEKLDTVLGLKEQGLTSTVLLPIGMRSANDAHANDAKVRWNTEDIIRMM